MKGSLRTGASLARLARSLYEEADRLIEEEERAALEAYFDALSACIVGADPGTPAIDLRQQILAFIHRYLSEPTLGPSEIASAMGISVRHLHRLFLLTGSSLGDYVRNRRLEGCRRDLANPYMRERSITEIAFFWGFSDSAHFSHAFKKQFGVSPRRFRVQCLHGGAATTGLFPNSSIDDILNLGKPN
jgi:AraC-like DNA-binding protein